MTENEKMLETMKLIAEKAKENEDIQMRNAALVHQRMVNSYMQAGFTRKEAIMVTTELIKATLYGGKK